MRSTDVFLFKYSTRVSNELGAGNPQGARRAACGVVAIGMVNGLVISSVLFATRRVFGYTFSNEKEVVNYVTVMAPLICVSVIIDSLQGVLSGMYSTLCFSTPHVSLYIGCPEKVKIFPKIVLPPFLFNPHTVHIRCC